MVFQEKTVCCSAKKDRKLACFLFGISINTKCNNASYTAEFKKKVVQAYLKGEGSYKDIAAKYKIH